ncbi:regulator [Rhizobium sp. Root564]|nr:regulator [Rhizobium sp. Root564]
MNVFYGTMTSKGQTTVPAEVRELLNLKSGDKLRYVVKNGTVILKAKNKKAADLAGVLSRSDIDPLAIEDIDDIVSDAVVNQSAERQ